MIRIAVPTDTSMPQIPSPPKEGLGHAVVASQSRHLLRVLLDLAPNARLQRIEYALGWWRQSNPK